MHYIIILTLLFSFSYSKNISLKDMKLEQRIALIIVNENYQDAPLKLATAQAKKMKKFLERQNFKVICKKNLSKKSTLRIIRFFNHI